MELAGKKRVMAAEDCLENCAHVKADIEAL